MDQIIAPETENIHPEYPNIQQKIEAQSQLLSRIVLLFENDESD